MLRSDLLKFQSGYQSNGWRVIYRRAYRKLGDAVLSQMTEDCGDAFFGVAFSLSGSRECVAKFIAKLPLVESSISDDGILQADSEKQMVEIFTGIDSSPTCDAGANIFFVRVVWHVILYIGRCGKILPDLLNIFPIACLDKSDKQTVGMDRKGCF